MMNVLGVEFSGSKLNYVLLLWADGNIEVSQSNQLELTDTRCRESLRSFQNAIAALINSTRPDIIGIKDKPETGRMRAGAAALKMEGILLAAASCDVEFVSGSRINACANGKGLKAYHQPAFKAARVTLKQRIGQ